MGEVVSENAAPPNVIIENLADAMVDDGENENNEMSPLPDNIDSLGVVVTNTNNESDLGSSSIEEVTQGNDEVELLPELTSLFADNEEVFFFSFFVDLCLVLSFLSS